MSSTRGLAIVFTCLLASTTCGGGGGGYSATPPTSPSPSPGGSSDVVTITITGVKGAQSFSPNPATIPAGQMAVFKNADVVTHRVVLDDRSVDTGDIAAGATSQPQALGSVSKPYHCSLHPSMVGSLNNAQTPEPPPCTGYCG